MWRIISWVVVIFTVCFTLWAGLQWQHLRFDHDIERFFPKNDPDLIYYNNFRKHFEADDNFILFAVSNKNGVFNKSFLTKVDSFRSSAIKITGIEDAVALSNLKQPIKTAFGLVPVNIFNWKQNEISIEDSLKVMADERLNGTFISTDGKWLSIVLKTKNHINHNELNSINAATQNLVKKFEFDDYHIAGKVYTVSTITKMIEKELVFYTIVSVLLVLLMLTIIFRRFWTIFTAFSSVVIGLVIFMGLLAWWGRPMDILSALFPILMLMVGMSDVIHIMTKYIDEVQLGEPEDKALVTAVKEIGWATLLTSITTSIGFASLITARIIPIRDFGLTAALGVIVAYLVVITFTVALLYLIPTKNLASQQKQFLLWENWMEQIFNIVKRSKVFIAILAFALIAFSLVGISKIDTNTSMLGDVAEKDKVRQDFFFFEKHFFGVRPFEAALIPQGGKNVHDPKVLKAIQKFNNYIQNFEYVGYGVSPITLYESINAAYFNNAAEQRIMPNNEKLLAKYRKDLKKAEGFFSGVIISKDEKVGRYSAKIKDLGADDMADFYKQTNNWIDSNIDKNILTIQLTGSGRLIDKNHFYIRQALFSGLGLAFIIISIIMAMLFRNIRMVLISIIPNLFPLLIAGAIMGYLNIELKASTSIIFCLAFGIAVDDTIHFLSKFKIELNKGKQLNEALKNTFVETGKAICLTTLVLLFGFSSLCLSDFSGTYYVGFLMCITLLSAVIADLIIMPVFIWWLYPKKEQTENIEK